MAVVMAGCAITPQRFEAEKYRMTELEVCQSAVDAYRGPDYSFRSSVEAEAARRGLTVERCKSLLEEDRSKKLAAAAVVLGVLAIAAAARGGGGGGGGAGAPTDYDWDWDMFYNQYRQLVWACRGVQSGQFADNGKCAYKVKTDSRWPSLEAPR